MSNNTPEVTIDLTPEYKRNLRKLSKKYRKIRLDIHPVIEELQAGNFLGDTFGGRSHRLSSLGEEYIILKLRVKNSDIQKGKSAGYRLIYQLESPLSVLLLTIFQNQKKRILALKKLSIF